MHVMHACTSQSIARRSLQARAQMSSGLASSSQLPVAESKVPAVRCDWVTKFTGAGDPDYVMYHDEEWGRPIKNDDALYELLVLEGAQAGLSWQTILRRRAGYRRAFAAFEPAIVAQYDDKKVQELVEDASIIRHRGKIISAINNARCVLQVQAELGSLSKLLWRFVPEGRPLNNNRRQLSDVPAKTNASAAMSKELRRRGFSYVGPTICYAFMQAAGLVNDHVVGCFCHAAVVQTAASWVPPE